MEILLFALVGVMVWLLARLIVTPETGVNPWNLLVAAIVGALVGGLVTPGLGLFVAPFLLIGSLLMALLGALLFVWFLALMMALFISGTDEPNRNY